jgi:argininosuccinate synthase
MKPRTVLAYSRSATSTDALRALAQTARGEVVALTLDLGQGGEIAPVREAALAAGAARAHVLDAREEFARAYAVPALAAPIPSDGWGTLIRSLARPLIAAKLREIAVIEGATIVSDGDAHDVDATMLGRVVTNGVYALTKPASAAPQAPAFVEIAFEGDVPSAINDVPMPLTELIESLATIAGQHGVGRIDDIEAPAAVVLHAALRARVGRVARLKLFKGTCERVPELVTHS